MIKKIISVIITVFMVISIGLCCVVVTKNAFGLDKSIFGLRVFYLVSGSMEPTIPVGAAVLVHRDSDYEINDVITFDSKDVPVSGFPNTHRIVGTTEVNGRKAYITKGDANSVPDDMPVTEDAIYGKVIWNTGKMQWLGTLVGMLTTPFGFISVIIIPIMVIIAIMMRNFSKEYKAALMAEAMGTAAAAPLPVADEGGAQPEQPAAETEAEINPEPEPPSDVSE